MIIQIIDKSQHDWHGMTVFYFNKKALTIESRLFNYLFLFRTF